MAFLLCELKKMEDALAFGMKKTSFGHEFNSDMLTSAVLHVINPCIENLRGLVKNQETQLETLSQQLNEAENKNQRLECVIADYQRCFESANASLDGKYLDLEQLRKENYKLTMELADYKQLREDNERLKMELASCK